MAHNKIRDEINNKMKEAVRIMLNQHIELTKWHFLLGNSKIDLEHSREVVVPHTWNIEDGSEEYYGTAWYGIKLETKSSWIGKRVFIHFGAVNHTAEIFLNGVKMGSHMHSGFTPFEIELTGALKDDEENWVTVKVNNDFSARMLPYKRSFDWPNDGGIIRSVTLSVTGMVRIKSCKINAKPFILDNGLRQNKGYGAFSMITQFDGNVSKDVQLDWQVSEGSGIESLYKDQGILTVDSTNIRSIESVWDEVKFWHFDEPNLYTLQLTLRNHKEIMDEKTIIFGFRELRKNGIQLILNGEPVRLCGTEWMPGSNPEIGMAECKEQLESSLVKLKESNCVLTRFHWQQDDLVYDWCDRNGILVQEEVPFWGKEPEKAGEEQSVIFNQQIMEMISSHQNHPSIFSWGVGNELSGQNKGTIQYIKNAIAKTHMLDHSRFASYVTNTILENPHLDGTTKGDILMINDYIGTWHGNLNQFDEWDKIVAANPGRTIMVSEFGLCEPAWSGGDARREEIFLDKMNCYRKYPSIVGTINFCLNDYRTQMGEDGHGCRRRRVHGSTDLYGNIKPSYHIIKNECSPIEVKEEEDVVSLQCRNNLPNYSVHGYFVRVYQPNHKVITIELPNMIPGERWQLKGKMDNDAILKIFRPTGSEVLTYNFNGSSSNSVDE